MGSRIAAHFANAGTPVVLLDLAPSSIAAAALEALKKSKPAAFFAPESAALIQTGNFDDNLALLKDCDWIVEAVAENLEIKRALLAENQPLPPRRRNRHNQYQRPSGASDRRRHGSRIPPLLVWHPFL